MSTESRRKQYAAVFQNWQIRETISNGAGGKSTLFRINRTDAYGESGTVKAVTIIERSGSFENLNQQQRGEFLAALREQQDQVSRGISRMDSLRQEQHLVSCLDYKFVNWIEQDSYGCDVLIRMEDVEDLRSLSCREQLSDEEVIRVGQEICRALTRCHGKNICHGDIKMENIYRGADGSYKLGDFGIAAGQMDSGTDLDRLGMVLYQLHGGKSNDTLGRVALKACGTNPQDRYQDAEELAWALEQLDLQETQLLEAWEAPVYTSSQPEQSTPQKSSKGGLIAACIALALSLLLLAGVVLWATGNLELPQIGAGKRDKTQDNTFLEFFDTQFTKETPFQSADDLIQEEWQEALEAMTEPAIVVTEAPAEICAEPATEVPEEICEEAATEGPEEVYTEAVGTWALPSKSVIASGQRHTVVILPDGSAIASGSNTYGQCNVSSWYSLVAAGAGDQHTVALRSDGTVVAAGHNRYGQCDVSSWTDVTEISVGDYHTLGLRADGSFYATGWNTYGQADAAKLANLAGGRKAVALAAGYEHTVMLFDDGTVAALGRNDFGQCNVSGWTDVIAIWAGTEHTVGLCSDGTLVATGQNIEGQCNIASWSDVCWVTAGDYFTVGLTQSGQLLCTGRNLHGELGLSNWSDVIAIGGGCAHMVGITEDGEILAAGWNEDGQCNIRRSRYE